MKTAYSQTYRVSKTLNAPMDFVYSWCTDFQEDDLKMIGSKNRRVIHERTKNRVIWTVEGPAGRATTDPVRVVWLRPPNAWHLETCGDGSEIGDYKLVSLGTKKTRLDMVFTETAAKKADLQSEEEYKSEAFDHWEKYGRALERDYTRSKS